VQSKELRGGFRNVFCGHCIPSFSRLATERAKDAGLCTILREVEIPADTPAAILGHVPRHTRVNYLSIDTEGLDAEILRHWPWDLSRPDIISCEALALGNSQVEVEAIFAGQEYAPIKLFPTCGFWGTSDVVSKL
jgi:hypothetical protein